MRKPPASVGGFLITGIFQSDALWLYYTGNPFKKSDSLPIPAQSVTGPDSRPLLSLESQHSCHCSPP